MMHHGLAIRCELDIDLDGEIASYISMHITLHVIDDPARVVMQATMGDRPRRQPGGCAHAITKPRTRRRPRPPRPRAARRRRRWCGHGGPCRRMLRPSG